MQIQLKQSLITPKESKDPSVLLDIELQESYGKNQQLNIYNQDRKAAVDSFKCYWQIDSMIQSRCFSNFPLIDMKQVDILSKQDKI